MKVTKSVVRLVKRHTVKVIVCSALFTLLFTSFLMMGTDASGTSPEAASNEEQVITVRPGDTLWEIAKQFNDSSHDIRYVVYMIKDRNELHNAEIKSGQKLIIPNI